MTRQQRREIARNIKELMHYRRGERDVLAETYAYMTLYYNAFGFVPTYATMARHFKITHMGVSKRMNSLRRMGYITMTKGASHGINILVFTEAA